MINQGGKKSTFLNMILKCFLYFAEKQTAGKCMHFTPIFSVLIQMIKLLY